MVKKSSEGPSEKAPETVDFIDHIKDAFVDSALAKEDATELAQAKERFGIRDRGSATWAAGKLAEAQAEIDRRKKQANLYVYDAEKKLERLEWLFLEQLREWARSNLDFGKRSVRLATATLSFRDVAAKLEILDEEALKKWAITELPDCLESVEKIMMDPLKNFWIKNEKVPPGAKAIPAGENFTVKG